MTPQVIDSFCQGKFLDDRNEDRLFVGPHHVAVIDGSSAAMPIDGRAGGIVAAELVVRVLESLAPDATIDQFEAVARNELAELGRRHSTPAPYAAAAVVSLYHQQIWRIGDCPFAIDGDWNIPPHNPHERAFFQFRQMMASGYRLETGDAALSQRLTAGIATATRDWLAMTKSWVNATADPFAFAALDERIAPARFREIHALPAGWRRITLASDGAVVSPRGQRGPANLADMMDQIGRLEACDPLCLEAFPYWRGFLDGATYLDDVTMLAIGR